MSDNEEVTPEPEQFETEEDLNNFVLGMLADVAPGELLYRMDALEALNEGEFDEELSHSEKAEVKKTFESEIEEWKGLLF